MNASSFGNGVKHFVCLITNIVKKYYIHNWWHFNKKSCKEVFLVCVIRASLASVSDQSYSDAIVPGLLYPQLLPSDSHCSQHLAQCISSKFYKYDYREQLILMKQNNCHFWTQLPRLHLQMFDILQGVE